MKNLCQVYLESASKKEKTEDLFDTLTQRQKELLELVVRGTPNKDIAKKLNISENTVRNHIAAIFTRLKINNRTEAAFLYHTRGSNKPETISHDDDHYWEKKESAPHKLESLYGPVK